ncbi:MAG: DUF1232 domain-containing protein [Burkholderiaceae bacterium]|nr:DUF1232 domain-containing protein [Burkholderiaceae bacterium]
MLFRLTRRLRAAGRYLLVGWHAWRHPALRWPGKLVLVLMALYLLTPIDIVPDGIPLLGWLDDFALVAIVLPLFLKLLPADIVRDARRKAGAEH